MLRYFYVRWKLCPAGGNKHKLAINSCRFISQSADIAISGASIRMHQKYSSRATEDLFFTGWVGLFITIKSYSWVKSMEYLLEHRFNVALCDTDFVRQVCTLTLFWFIYTVVALRWTEMQARYCMVVYSNWQTGTVSVGGQLQDCVVLQGSVDYTRRQNYLTFIIWNLKDNRYTFPQATEERTASFTPSNMNICEWISEVSSEVFIFAWKVTARMTLQTDCRNMLVCSLKHNRCLHKATDCQIWWIHKRLETIYTRLKEKRNSGY